MVREWGSASVKAVPLGWPVGKVICGEMFGHVFFAHEPGTLDWMTANELPVEFWNHQLAAVDTKDADSVLRFVEQFGFPFSPWRNSLAGDFLVGCCGMFEETPDAIGATQNLMLNDSMGKLMESRTESDAAKSPVISYDEVVLTIQELQQCVKNLIQAVTDGSVFTSATILNIGGCNPMTATDANTALIDRTGEDLHSVGLLSAAICNQIIESIADNALWRECASDTCSRIFKRKQGAKNPHLASSYCCKMCADAQRQRNQRAAAKNRIQH